jgi:hypothetical protein
MLARSTSFAVALLGAPQVASLAKPARSASKGTLMSPTCNSLACAAGWYSATIRLRYELNGNRVLGQTTRVDSLFRAGAERFLETGI